MDETSHPAWYCQYTPFRLTKESPLASGLALRLRLSPLPPWLGHMHPVPPPRRSRGVSGACARMSSALARYPPSVLGGVPWSGSAWHGLSLFECAYPHLSPPNPLLTTGGLGVMAGLSHSLSA